MLPDPQTGLPIIQKWLQIAIDNQFDLHIIIRPEKKSLLHYLEDFTFPPTLKMTIQLYKPKPGEEWPKTILASKKFWKKWMIIGLPDTDFSPKSLFQNLNHHFQQKNLIIWTFPVKDSYNWGMVSKPNENKLIWCEKPKNWPKNFNQAWGIFSFKKSIGKKLLTELENSTQNSRPFFISNAKMKLLSLETFYDLTRK